jgi:hypothetical protein
MTIRRWLGHAVDIAQQTNVSVTGDWDAGDTATLSIAGKDVTLTLAASSTSDDVIAGLVNAWNSSAIPEFAEASAANATPNIQLTGKTAGIPFEVSTASSSTNTGVLGVATTTIAATGRHHFDDPDNWSDATLPADGDSLVFDSGNVSVKYGLQQSLLTPSSVRITQAYSGQIGLPETNENNLSTPYREYRQQALQLGNDADAILTQITIGEGGGPGSGRIYLDSGDGQIVLVVRNSGPRANTSVPAILWRGSHVANEVNISRGDLGIATRDDETANLSLLSIGYQDDPTGDSQVVVGTNVTLTDVVQTGGRLDLASSTSTLDIFGGRSTIHDGAHSVLQVSSARLVYRSTGAIQQAYIGRNGVLDFRQDNRSRTVAACQLHASGSVLDSFRTVIWTTGIDLVQATLEATTLDLGTNLKLTPSSI